MTCDCIYTDETKDIRLVTGDMCCRRCEQWRMECEARDILKEPTKARRQIRLLNIERRRGAEHVKLLKKTIMRVWNEERK